MGRGLCLELSRRDRHQLEELLSGGLQPVRTVLRALALRQMEDGQSTAAVGVSLGLSAYLSRLLLYAVIALGEGTAELANSLLPNFSAA